MIYSVMPGFAPGTDVFARKDKDVGGGDKPGQDQSSVALGN
jgi:hypothetical protein